MDQPIIELTKSRVKKTHQGCLVETVTTYNSETRCIDENIVLSHPYPIAEVAFSADAIFERMAR